MLMTNLPKLDQILLEDDFRECVRGAFRLETLHRNGPLLVDATAEDLPIGSEDDRVHSTGSHLKFC